MWGGSSGPEDSEAWEDFYINFLRECVNLTTLALYFQSSHFEREWTKLRDAILTLMTKGKLTSLVFYNYRLYESDFFFLRYCEHNVRPILQAIAHSDLARCRLKRLHLALSDGLIGTELLFQSMFPSLGSLVIGGSLWRRSDFGRADGSKHLHSLTSLQISKCSSIAAPDIPDIVRLFPALRELLVSKLSSRTSTDFSIQYPIGWHLLPKALCNTRQPLEWIHIEASNSSSQIQFLGVIPTKMLVITDIWLGRLFIALTEDVHLFPGMQVLRYQKISGLSKCNRDRKTEDIEDPVSLQAALDEWCTTRNVEMIKVKCSWCRGFQSM
jgi:hypothetical protein